MRIRFEHKFICRTKSILKFTGVFSTFKLKQMNSNKYHTNIINFITIVITSLKILKLSQFSHLITKITIEIFFIVSKFISLYTK